MARKGSSANFGIVESVEDHALSGWDLGANVWGAADRDGLIASQWACSDIGITRWPDVENR
jgi:hypothetical protein